MEQENKSKLKEKSKGQKIGKAIYEKCLLAARVFLRRMETVSEAFWKQFLAEKGREKKSFVSRLYAALFFLAVFSFSAVVSLARFPLRVYPAGFALLSALGGRQRAKGKEDLILAVILSSFSGVLLSCAFVEKYGFFYLLAYLILFMARAGITAGKLNESILARVTFSASMAVGLGLLVSMFESFSVRSVFAAVSFGILTPLITYLLCGFYVFIGSDLLVGQIPSQKKVYVEGAFFTLAYLFLYALKDISFFSVSPAFVLAVLFTLILARTRGALYGAAAGMIGGMAAASSGTAPALAVAGFFAGLFFEYSGYVAMTVSFVAACGYCMYTEGLGSFGYFTADYLLALLLFVPLWYLFPKSSPVVEKASFGEVITKDLAGKAKEKLRSMSDAFSSLSEVFYTVSDTIKKPKLSECSRLVSDCCSQICSQCALSGVCWGQEQGKNVDATTLAATRLLTEGKVKKEDFSEPFRSKCIHLSRLLELINQRYDVLSGGFLKNNKTRLLAGEYSSVSRLLKSTAGELSQELEYNPMLEERANKVLRNLGIYYRRVAVFGNRELKIDVYGIKMDRVSFGTDKILSAFEKEFSCLFDAPSFLMFEESVVMRLRRKRVLSLECAKSGYTKKGEAVSGDHLSFFETDREYFYTLICDGMGSGREAAFTSRLASIFIEKLMHCATPKNVTLEMLNAFLMSKTDETFTTVDLLEIDLLSAGANFIKAGAAPSYILRGDRLHRIESRTPPAGILNRMCAEQTSFTLKAGDFVILLSDGADLGESGSVLASMIAGKSFENAGALCDLIFQGVKENRSVSDDLSISVIRVMNNK